MFHEVTAEDGKEEWLRELEELIEIRTPHESASENWLVRQLGTATYTAES
jgi:hypothetical protein